ncbi:hypothetical protein [Myceligenerans pegani]|uniref:Peptidase inhibitor family I36 n=1 Tax=Myceligenerans pegani TaxID=2776917 RepID=A0ABR9N2G4_9MICO|nr:hypothetical protein [Myceligenerans sp. TRM 65318]MBE1877344.1 hypothetical protein [Myceligenerans sp. TRM 65318]MBE3019615.1 hypothetical protein [Myceligenerans sp. TRM 65318]
MTLSKRALAALAGLLMALAGVLGTTQAAQAADDARGSASEATSVTDDQAPRGGIIERAASVTAAVHGCPSGAFCIYPNASWNGGNPEYVFWSRGGHNIYNEYGQRRAFNNQTDNWGGALCYGSNGTGGYRVAFRPGIYVDLDITPINSADLQPGSVPLTSMC